MNKFTSFMSKTIAKSKVKAVKYGPAIMVAVGVAGMATTVYLTYKATTKIEAAKKERDDNLAAVASSLETGFVTKADGTDDIYSHEDGERDTRIYNTRFIVNVVKYLALPVGTFLISVWLIGKGFNAKASQLATALTTIAGLSAQNKELREDLVNAVGKEKANDILLGKNAHTETEISEDGEVTSKEVTTTNRFVTGYTFEFSKESSPQLYSGIYERDLDFITGNLNRANWLMDVKKGFCTFADILEEFEIPMEGLGYALTDGSVETPGHTIIFDIDERNTVDDNGKNYTYFIITVNCQGFIANKI